MSAFITMGGYGTYVWAAFGFAAIVLTGLMWQSSRFARKQAALLADLQTRAPRGRPRRRPVVTRLESAPDTAVREPQQS